MLRTISHFGLFSSSSFSPHPFEAKTFNSSLFYLPWGTWKSQLRTRFTDQLLLCWQGRALSTFHSPLHPRWDLCNSAELHPPPASNTRTSSTNTSGVGVSTIRKKCFLEYLKRSYSWKALFAQGPVKCISCPRKSLTPHSGFNHPVCSLGQSGSECSRSTAWLCGQFVLHTSLWGS